MYSYRGNLTRRATRRMARSAKSGYGAQQAEPIATNAGPYIQQSNEAGTSTTDERSSRRTTKWGEGRAGGRGGKAVGGGTAVACGRERLVDAADDDGSRPHRPLPELAMARCRLGTGRLHNSQQGGGVLTLASGEIRASGSDDGDGVDDASLGDSVEPSHSTNIGAMNGQ